MWKKFFLANFPLLWSMMMKMMLSDKWNKYRRYFFSLNESIASSTTRRPPISHEKNSLQIPFHSLRPLKNRIIKWSRGSEMEIWESRVWKSLQVTKIKCSSWFEGIFRSIFGMGLKYLFELFVRHTSKANEEFMKLQWKS